MPLPSPQRIPAPLLASLFTRILYGLVCVPVRLSSGPKWGQGPCLSFSPRTMLAIGHALRKWELDEKESVNLLSSIYCFIENIYQVPILWQALRNQCLARQWCLPHSSSQIMGDAGKYQSPKSWISVMIEYAPDAKETYTSWKM